MLPIRTIVHATDLSDSSGAGFRLACSLARDYGARLIVLHVQPLPATFYAMEPGFYPPEDQRPEVLNRLHDVRPEDPAVRVEHRLVEGDAADEILRVARETNADLIVLGTHGRKGLGRLLLGSVAEQVVRKAACPVVTVKPTTPAEIPAAGSAEKHADEVMQGAGS
jgi:nucleotide-binding universal stress UspA family protein